MADPATPRYDAPPVVETILGVQFEPLAEWRNIHLGAFWNALPDKWRAATVFDVPPLEPQVERFDAESILARWQFHLRLDADARRRAQFRLDDRMIQVQNGRLILNWIKQDPTPYPGYETMKAEFSETLDRFQTFLTQCKLGDFLPNQWEVTYLNRIPIGSLWNQPSNWSFFRSLGRLDGPTESLRLESLAGQWHYEITPRRGRLHVEWTHSRRDESKDAEAIILTLTARGPLSEENRTGEAVLGGLDLGHETIIRAFPALVTDEANTFWGIRNG
ncbi:MAG: TIGR04255 family protein [Pirellulales bacterium]